MGPEGVGGRLWFGNRVTVAPHFDASDNVACVAAGRRRFILFPPEQVSNLYVGPFDLTPAGVPVSTVPLDAPDLERYPRYREALAAAQIAELEPGDAIYIPYMWWHGVQSLDPFNVLVNYWWNEDRVAAEHPFGALLHTAHLLYRDMPPHHREAWRALYGHFVFDGDGGTVDERPPEHRGSARPIDPAARLKAALGALLRGIED